MATIRAFTSVEQSRKLATILPLESADMYWWYSGKRHYIEAMDDGDFNEGEGHIRAWSLAALLNVLPVTTTLLKDGNISNTGDVKYSCECSMINIYKWFDNAIDACYELILKLHKLNIL